MQHVIFVECLQADENVLLIFMFNFWGTPGEPSKIESRGHSSLMNLTQDTLEMHTWYKFEKQCD